MEEAEDFWGTEREGKKNHIRIRGGNTIVMIMQMKMLQRLEMS